MSMINYINILLENRITQKSRIQSTSQIQYVMVYVAADLKYYRIAKKFNATNLETLMSYNNINAFLCFSQDFALSKLYIIQSSLIYISRNREFLEKTNLFVLIFDFQFKKTTMQFYDQFFQKKKIFVHRFYVSNQKQIIYFELKCDANSHQSYVR